MISRDSCQWHLKPVGGSDFKMADAFTYMTLIFKTHTSENTLLFVEKIKFTTKIYISKIRYLCFLYHYNLFNVHN